MRCRLRFFLWRLPPAWLSLMHHLRCVSMSCVPSPWKKRFSWRSSTALSSKLRPVGWIRPSLHSVQPLPPGIPPLTFRPADSLNISSLIPTETQIFPINSTVTVERVVMDTTRVAVNGGRLQVSWDLINPARVPQIAAARDRFERAGDAYLIALRDLRLEVQTAYFDLQQADEGVRIGQDSVKASLVSYRDARARFNAGVNTKLEVLEAETQLARDRNTLTTNLRDQNEQRRNLARVLDLPQDVTPTAATPARPLGLWEPSLQESIVAAYNYREELDQLILDISINNSQANASLAAVQPVLSFVNSTSASRTEGQTGQTSLSDIDMGDFTYGVQNSTALTASWRLFDGGRARAEYRRSKQAAEQSRLRFR